MIFNTKSQPRVASSSDLKPGCTLESFGEFLSHTDVQAPFPEVLI